MPRAIGILACLALVTGALACQSSLSDVDLDRMVEAFVSNPEYRPAMETSEEEIRTMMDVMMEHPSMQTTPREHCVTVILMSVVMSGDYTLPPDSEGDRLCDWYMSQS